MGGAACVKKYTKLTDTVLREYRAEIHSTNVAGDQHSVSFYSARDEGTCDLASIHSTSISSVVVGNTLRERKDLVLFASILITTTQIL